MPNKLTQSRFDQCTAKFYPATKRSEIFCHWFSWYMTSHSNVDAGRFLLIDKYRLQLWWGLEYSAPSDLHPPFSPPPLCRPIVYVYEDLHPFIRYWQSERDLSSSISVYNPQQHPSSSHHCHLIASEELTCKKTACRNTHGGSWECWTIASSHIIVFALLFPCRLSFITTTVPFQRRIDLIIIDGAEPSICVNSK